MWDDLDIDYKNKHIILYSGNGWRSSEVMYYAQLMGLYRVSMYDGGWYDWSTKFGKLDQSGGEDTQVDDNETNATTVKTTVNATTVRFNSARVMQMSLGVISCGYLFLALF